MHREELWQQLEARAMSNPAYRATRPSQGDASPTDDANPPELTYQRIEQEAQEVS